MALNRDSWWTPLSTPRPPDTLIEAAARDVPTALAEGGRPGDLNGAYYLEIGLLFLALEQMKHARNSIVWALDEMIRQGLVHAVSFTYERRGNSILVPHQGICSGERLWDWWRNASPLFDPGEGDQDEELNTDDTLTLEEAGCLVHRSKSCLRHHKGKGLPEPCQTGKPYRYRWSEMREFLEKTFKVQLPKRRTE